MFTFLITDVFLYMIVIALGCYVYYVRNNYDLSKNWKLVFKKTTGVISIVFLTFFIFIALIDSIHFKTKMWNEQENEYVGLWNSLNFVKLREILDHCSKSKLRVKQDQKIISDLFTISASTSFSLIFPAVPRNVHIVLSESGVTNIKHVPVGNFSLFL